MVTVNIMKKNKKLVSIVLLSMLMIAEVLCILYFGSTAINIGITLVFPQTSIDVPQKELISLAYLPLLFIGISAGFMWLTFKTAKLINKIRGVDKVINQDVSIQYGSWKIITVTLIIVIAFFYAIRANLGPV